MDYLQTLVKNNCPLFFIFLAKNSHSLQCAVLFINGLQLQSVFCLRTVIFFIMCNVGSVVKSATAEIL